MMHLVTCLGEKNQLSFQGDDDPPQKATTTKKTGEVFEILLARGLAYFSATSSAGPSSALLNSI